MPVSFKPKSDLDWNLCASKFLLRAMMFFICPHQPSGIRSLLIHISTCLCAHTWARAPPSSHMIGLINRTQAVYIWSTWHAWKIITLRLTSEVDGLQQLPSHLWLFFLLLSGLGWVLKKSPQYTECFSCCHMIAHEGLTQRRDLTQEKLCALWRVRVILIIRDKMEIRGVRQ